MTEPDNMAYEEAGKAPDLPAETTPEGIPFDRITEENIPILVNSFYARIRKDDRLGPIFDGVIGDHWGEHLLTMYRFWSSVMLVTGRYKGRPMPKHFALKDRVVPEDFDRWLELFGRTAADLYEPVIAERFYETAVRIAESFKLGMFYNPADVIRATPA